MCTTFKCPYYIHIINNVWYADKSRYDMTNYLCPFFLYKACVLELFPG